MRRDFAASGANIRRAGLHFPAVDAAGLEADADARLVSGAQEALAAAGVTIDSVRLVVSHYLDPRVARRAASRLGAPDDRVVAPAERFGHVSSGGPIMVVAEAVANGVVGPGDLLLITTMGAGISWGAAVVRL
jgi:3-oxoacyl-[acyl-carrier-protein] synthase-3